jgi:Carboxypeptidase regulatory-like domain
MRLRYVLLGSLLLGSAACHADRPVVDPTPKQSVGGTIAGIVKTTDSSVAVSGRKVTVTEITTGSHYESTTAANGGYTIRVPEGTYRIEIELRPSETLQKKPEQTHVNNGDTDSGRDFVITAR